jgi:hypothetical protein
MARVLKVVVLAMALAGSAGLVFWMSEHGDLEGAMKERPVTDEAGG